MLRGRDARTTVEGWVAAALAGDVQKAAPLADPNTSLATEKGVKKSKGLVGGAAVKVANVYASEKRGQAVAKSEPVRLAKANPDGRDTGVPSFELVRVGGKWLLKDTEVSLPAWRNRVEGNAPEQARAVGMLAPPMADGT
jgi:hypothetical protein